MSEKNAPEIRVRIKADDSDLIKLEDRLERIANLMQQMGSINEEKTYPASLQMAVQEACNIGAREGAKKARDKQINDEKETSIKLSKLFIRGVFKGYALTVNGKILSNQESTVIESKPQEIPRVKASFIVTDEMIVDAPDIYLKDYIYRSAEEVNA
ncbi:hypothetical protein [Arsenophonus nasoniae]|uniref:Uncharacterized protein n=1 Tax=Arsenophonus nasoniae TaxID=638 RepID=A0A4P7KXB9_9GAMM|nr:hypothetical protein [Arsenophonus nasoniae]QBY44741.1 hypothetical protein ArsFIN_33270 [Arsenophonus nasoniae]